MRLEKGGWGWGRRPDSENLLGIRTPVIRGTRNETRRACVDAGEGNAGEQLTHAVVG